MSVARVLALVAVIAFVVGLGGVFGWTYREQSHTVAQLRADRDGLRAENRRLAASLASAQSAFASLNAGLAQTRNEARAARGAWSTRWLEGYSAGFLAALVPDPYADDLPPRGRQTLEARPVPFDDRVVVQP